MLSIKIDDGSGRFLLEYDPATMMFRLAGFPCYVSNNVPGNLVKGTLNTAHAIIFGNWSQMIVGKWSDVDVIVDPFTEATKRKIRVTCYQDVDIAVRHVEAFAVIVDANPAA